MNAPHAIREHNGPWPVILLPPPVDETVVLYREAKTPVCGYMAEDGHFYDAEHQGDRVDVFTGCRVTHWYPIPRMGGE